MGWKGTMRSLAAAARAAEREAQRRRKQQMKEQMYADSSAAVEDWHDYINDLVSIHVDTTDAIDWHHIARQEPPREPILEALNQNRAEAALRNFKPSVFHFFKGGSAKLRAQLETAVDKAAVQDQQEYQSALTSYSKKLAEWEEETRFAKRLIDGDTDATRQVIDEMLSLSEGGLVGTEVAFAFKANLIHASVSVHGDEIVPQKRRKQLASGRLSETNMPKGQFNELYQDYVASVALKMAGDLLNILPFSEVYVTFLAKMLDTSTGYQNPTPILSVHFVRETFERLNLEAIDPSDSMENFRHNMIFSKTKGFSRIEPIIDLSESVNEASSQF